jgi:nicotinamidase-related amidase
MDNTALLLIDLQNDYFDDGKMPLVGSADAVAEAARLLAAARAATLPVIHIQHLSVRPGAPFFVPDTTGVEIHPAVTPAVGEPLMQKNFPNAFRKTPLEAYLREQGINHLIVAGMMTHMCIDTSVRAAFDLGFRVTLAHDACATRNLTHGHASIAAAVVHTVFTTALDGTFATTRSSAEIIADLQANS